MSLVARAAGDLAGLTVRVRFGDDLGRLRAVEEAPARGERTFFHRLDHVLGKRVVVVGRARGREGPGRGRDPPRADRGGRARAPAERLPRPPLLRDPGPLLRGAAAPPAARAGHGHELHLGRRGQRRAPHAPRLVRRLLVRPRADDARGHGEGDRRVREDGRRGLARLPREEGALPAHRRDALPRPQPELRRPRGPASASSTSRARPRGRRPSTTWTTTSWATRARSAPTPTPWTSAGGSTPSPASARGCASSTARSTRSTGRGGAPSRDWDAVLPLTTEAARREGRFAPWADHRTYMEVSFARAYQTVRDGVREGDPEGRIALSGTQVTNPWNGCDWHRLDAVIDDFLSYSGGNQWDIHRSFAKPGARIGFWTGYGRSGAAVKHEVWTAALQGVLHPQLFWSPSIVNPDMTFSRSGRDLGEAFRALRFEGIGRLLMEAERLDDGVAVHYSMPSVHAAGILGHHDREEAKKGGTSFPANRDGWVSVLDDLGLSFRFLATPQVEAGRAPGEACLRPAVLDGALRPRGRRRSAASWRRAASSSPTAAAGLFDEHVAWRETGALDALFGVSAPSPRGRGRRRRRGLKGTVRVTARRRGSGPAGAGSRRPRGPRAGGARQGGARRSLRVGAADLAVVNRVGKGRAVYLNALLDREGASRDAWRARRARGPRRRRRPSRGLGHRPRRAARHAGPRRALPLRRARGRRPAERPARRQDVLRPRRRHRLRGRREGPPRPPRGGRDAAPRGARDERPHRRGARGDEPACARR